MSVKTICFANLKGGVGKTTSTINIGYAFMRFGYKVCLIDLDPQANLTVSLGLDCTDPSTYDLIVGKLGFLDVCKKINETMSILPSHFLLIKSDFQLASVIFEREKILDKKLAPFKKNFDYILIDSAPNLGIVTVNGLVTSNYIFVPMEAEFLALQGFSILEETLQEIGTYSNGIFLTKYDRRKTLHKSVLQKIEELYPKKLFHTKIRDNIKIAEAQSQGLDIFSYDSKCHGAEDYMQLTEEILENIGGHNR